MPADAAPYIRVPSLLNINIELRQVLSSTAHNSSVSSGGETMPQYALTLEGELLKGCQISVDISDAQSIHVTVVVQVEHNN